MHKTLNLIPFTMEVDAGESEVHGYPQLSSEFEASLGYRRHSLKRIKNVKIYWLFYEHRNNALKNLVPKSRNSLDLGTLDVVKTWPRLLQGAIDSYSRRLHVTTGIFRCDWTRDRGYEWVPRGVMTAVIFPCYGSCLIVYNSPIPDLE